MGFHNSVRALLLGALCGAGIVLFALHSSGAAAQEPALTAGEQAYLEWWNGYRPRLSSVAAAAPTSLQLGNTNWRREQVLAMDAWGALIQEARDQRPSGAAQAVHSQLLDTLDLLDHARRALLVAVALAQEPGPEMATSLRDGRQALETTANRARTLAQGRPPVAAGQSLRRGDLRVSVLDFSRPYTERGTPADVGWEYVTVRLRLENTGGDPLRYDAFQFRLRAADDTMHDPIPLGIADELLYGGLEGNRLASGVVGNIAYAVRRGVAAVSLSYESGQSDSPLEIPVADRTPRAAPTSSATRD